MAPKKRPASNVQPAAKVYPFVQWFGSPNGGFQSSKSDLLRAAAQPAAAKQAAQDKLKALGLTDIEVAALVGA